MYLDARTQKKSLIAHHTVSTASSYMPFIVTLLAEGYFILICRLSASEIYLQKGVGASQTSPCLLTAVDKC